MLKNSKFQKSILFGKIRKNLFKANIEDVFRDQTEGIVHLKANYGFGKIIFDPYLRYHEEDQTGVYDFQELDETKLILSTI